ncbi:MAG: TIGR04255 family protein [Sphingobacteriaceae bacterium]|nr:MAG: TIGR04255 family protein [Sphingobacteriaceae bacterium]
MELLQKSPLVETTCEIIFMPSPVYDTTLPGMLFMKLENEFPVKNERPGGIIMAPKIDNNRETEVQSVQLSQFFSSDNSQVVQIGKDILVNNMLKPYKGWDVFKRQIIKVVEAYSSNFVEKPVIRKVLLRYMNVFNFNDGVNHSDVFTFNLGNPPEEKYQKNRAFNSSLEYDSENGGILSLGYRTVYPNAPFQQSIVMEITNQQIVPKSISFENFDSWLEVAHLEIENLFLASLTQDFKDSIL